MMAITQWNLVFAHVPSMRPIADIGANGEVERLNCDPLRYIDEEFWDRTEVTTVRKNRPFPKLKVDQRSLTCSMDSLSCKRCRWQAAEGARLCVGFGLCVVILHG